ncbi:MAG: thiol:disulfide interchange protein DsbA/DsbL [Rhodanobacter sp.]
MRSIRLLLATLALLCLAIPGYTASTQGEDYTLLSPPQPTESGKKVEVIEFFAYYCPNCSALDRPLTEWAKAHADKIVFKRVHISPNGEPMPQQRLYYTLDALGKAEEYQSKVFYAVHVQHVRLNTDEDVIDFMAKSGMDRDKFTQIYNSPSVQTKVQRALQMMSSYQISSWPTIVIDGKYVTSPAQAGSRLPKYDETAANQLMLKVMDDLVDQLAKTRH